MDRSQSHEDYEGQWAVSNILHRAEETQVKHLKWIMEKRVLNYITASFFYSSSSLVYEDNDNGGLDRTVSSLIRWS